MDAVTELQTLWTRLFGEPPFIRAEAKLLIRVLVSALPLAPPYKPTAASAAAMDREAAA